MRKKAPETRVKSLPQHAANKDKTDNERSDDDVIFVDEFKLDEPRSDLSNVLRSKSLNKIVSPLILGLASNIKEWILLNDARDTPVL